MKRRNFLKGLFAAPVAAPAIVNATMAEAQKMAMQPSGYIGSEPEWSNNAIPCVPDKDYWRDEINNLRKYLTDLVTDEMFRKKVADQKKHVTRLDPDLSVCRSLSLDARIRMQAERDTRRYIETEKKSTEDRIATYTKYLLG